MLERPFFRRAFPIGVCAAVFFLCTTPAKGRDKDRIACNTAYGEYKAAGTKEQAGHLLEARDLYQSCSRATCAGLVQKCSARYATLSAGLPTVVPVVTDDAGEPCVDVQVKVDGEVVTSRLDGRGITVEPGVHEFAFVGEKGVYATRKIMIIEGDKNRPIPVTFHSQNGKAVASAKSADTSTEAGSPQSAPAEASHEGATREEGHSLVLPFVVGGGGLLAVAAGGFLTVWGNRDNDLLSSCSPHCSPSSVSHIRTLYTLSDISFGVGAAAIGVAAWLLWPSKRGNEPSPRRAAYIFDVDPSSTGAVASVKGAF